MSWLKIAAIAFGILGFAFWALYYFADQEIGRLGTAFFLIAIALNLYRFRLVKEGRNG